MKIVFSIVSLLLFVGPSAGADFTYQEYTKEPGETVRVPADLPSPIRYHAVRPSLAGSSEIRSIETARVHHATRRRGFVAVGGLCAARRARAAYWRAAKPGGK